MAPCSDCIPQSFLNAFYYHVLDGGNARRGCILQSPLETRLGRTSAHGGARTLGNRAAFLDKPVVKEVRDDDLHGDVHFVVPRRSPQPVVRLLHLLTHLKQLLSNFTTLAILYIVRFLYRRTTWDIGTVVFLAPLRSIQFSSVQFTPSKFTPLFPFLLRK